MKSKLSFLLALALIWQLILPVSAAGGNNIDALAGYIDGIAAQQMEQAGATDMDACLAASAGTGPAEWMMLAMRQYRGGDFSTYLPALRQAAAKLSHATATDRQRIALAYAVLEPQAPEIQTTISSTVGKLGIMSNAFGLILLDSGAYAPAGISRDGIIRELLSQQLGDGGWALRGTVGDVDVTAMTLTALAPYQADADVQPAVARALAMLSARQTAYGDFASFGVRNAESTAQVMTALCTLGLDPRTDARFIKNGHAVLDGLLLYRLENGGFAHVQGGKVNAIASAQAMCGLVDLWRLEGHMLPLYRFTAKQVPREKAPVMTDAPVTPVTPSPVQTAGTGTTAVEPLPAETTTTGVGETLPAAQSSLPDAVTGTTQATREPTSATSTVAGTTTVYNAAQQPDGTAFRPIAYVCILLLAGGVVLFLCLRRRASRKNLLLVVAVTTAAVAVVSVLRIQSVAEFYSIHPDTVTEDTPSVTVSIRCDTAVGQSLQAPADGVMLPATAYALQDGDTVYDVLLRVTRYQQLPLDAQGTEVQGFGTMYVRGIGGLYEFDCGPLSGWMYSVNGEKAEVGCSAYALEDGDVVAWLYSCDLGKDVALP